MSSPERPLPLFPLNVVLFPGVLMPLHIFEDRYILMVQRCLDGDSQFGVVLIESGPEVGEPAEPHSIGTVARITQRKQLEQGRVLLTVEGRQRFRIREVTQRRPYLEALVEIVEDEREVDVAPAELHDMWQAVVRHVRLILGLRGGWSRRTRVPDDPAALSYFVGEILQVGLLEKQALLEEPSTARRLQKGLLKLERQHQGLKGQAAQELGQRRFSRN